jgi:hypothetical protein
MLHTVPGLIALFYAGSFGNTSTAETLRLSQSRDIP